MMQKTYDPNYPPTFFDLDQCAACHKVIDKDVPGSCECPQPRPSGTIGIAMCGECRMYCYEKDFDEGRHECREMDCDD